MAKGQLGPIRDHHTAALRWGRTVVMVPPRHHTAKCDKQIRFGWKVRAADPVRRLTAVVKQLRDRCGLSRARYSVCLDDIYVDNISFRSIAAFVGFAEW